MNTRDLVQFRLKVRHDRFAVQLFQRNVIGTGKGGAIIPWDQFDLQLTDGITRALCTCGIRVQTTCARKGKDGLDAGNRQRDLFGLTHEDVFFRKAQVAARLNVDDRLFWFGRGKEFDAVIVRPEIGEGRHNDGEDRAHGDKRHDRVTGHAPNHPAKRTAVITCTDFRLLAFNLGRADGDR